MKRTTEKREVIKYTMTADELRDGILDKLSSTKTECGSYGLAAQDAEINFMEDGSVEIVSVYGLLP